MLSGIFLIALAVVFCLARPVVARTDDGPALDKVTLQLRWFHQFQFAGYYAAKAKGFYADAGLDVEIIERDIKVNPVDAVLEGKADFGVTNSELLIHRLEGKPVVVLASIFQHSPLVLLSRREKGISTPHDLIGKRVLMSTKTMDVELLGMFQKEKVGIDRMDVLDRFSRESDYYDASIDAVAAYITNQPYYLKARNLSYNILYPASYGIDFYGDCLFTTERQIEDHPERVLAFREASLKGWAYAMDHPEEMIDLILATYKTNKTRPHLVYEAVTIEDLMLPDLVEIGHMNPGRWKHIADVFSSLGMVSPDASLEGFIYDPAPPADYERLNTVMYILAGIILMLVSGALALGMFNRRLQSKVQLRTEALTEKAQELERVNRRLTELDRVKSALLSSVSHELRTPLTSVLGFVKLIRKEFDRSFGPLAAGDSALEGKRHRIEKNLNVITVEGERLARLISDVLDLSKMESGKAVWRDRELNMPELARNAVAVVQEQFARNPMVELVVNVRDDLPRIHADPDRIVQVLINLLSNAAKFTREGEVSLSVVPDDNGFVQITVCDTGIGIPGEEVEDIFNMFHQVRRDDTLKVDTQGAGLGLAICKEIVEHYGGTIVLESEPGRGSTFTVNLPVSDG